MKTKSQIRKTEYPHIVRVEGVLGGQAIIESTRIAVWHIVSYYYKVGMSVEDILAEWDYLRPAQIFSALAYYHDHKEEIDALRDENSYERWQQQQVAHGQRLLETTNETYAALSANPDAWQALREEQAEWDVTLNDGLNGRQ